MSTTHTIRPYLRLSGLEPLVVRPETNFLNVGERTNVTGSKKISRGSFAKDYTKKRSPLPASRWKAARRFSM